MAQAAASSVNKEMEISMERLSTGKRINGASDDAAGVAIASRLTSEIKGTNQAIRNAMDGQALIDTAEGAHQEIESILQRMRELAVQAANDTNDANDRTNIQAELDQLVNEIDRISSTTTWAGQQIMDGSDANGVNLQIGSGTKAADYINVAINSTSASTLNVTGAATDGNVVNGSKDLASGAALAGTAYTISSNVITLADDLTAAATFTLEMGDNTDVVVTSTKSITYDAGDIEANEAAAHIADLLNRSTDFAGFTAIASTDGSGDITINKGAISVSSTSEAQSAIGKIDTAIQTLNAQRASLGAYSNRLDSTVSNLTNISSNLQAGRGRIEDADFAAETTSLAKSQILQQASTAMLAQANASKQNVLSLLQG
ncbi:flagellin [Alphaproteobacteria bacterium US3C007]|nr:flagellin [Alphaproteobacteria bacterium US3C007]